MSNRLLEDNVINIDKQITEYLEYFERENTPIEVSFRDLLPSLNKIDRYTHLIHSYPAKLLVQIPYFFLNNTIFSNPNSLILDPFCGTGTVLLEAIISNRNAIGVDSNPLARLISEVKVSKFNKLELEETLQKILDEYRITKKCDIPEVVNRDHWFSKKTQKELAKIIFIIEKIENSANRKFFQVCFSNCVKKVSFSDPRVSVPVKLNYKKYKPDSLQWKSVKKSYDIILKTNVLEKFITICKENIKRSEHLNNELNNWGKVISQDSRKIFKSLNSTERYNDEMVDLILTSPPYAGAQKYIRASSLCLGWLKLATVKELKELDKKTIGRENYKTSEYNKPIITGIKNADTILEKVYDLNPQRAHIAGNYLLEMMDALKESYRVLKKRGYMIIIIGNNQVCGFEFNTQDYFTSYLLSLGMQLRLKLIDDIRSYGLMTKRNKSASIITREWVLVFQK